MKRFLVFSYGTYYPSGGWNDFSRAFDSLKEAKAHAAALNPKGLLGQYENTHIVDLKELKVVA